MIIDRAPIVYDPAELRRVSEASRERDRRWSQPGYREVMEKTLDNSPEPLPTRLRDGGGPERRRVIAELRKTEQRLVEIDDQQASLTAERALLMEAETCDQRRVNGIATEIEKLARERELTEAKKRGWIKRAVVAEGVDAVALATRAVKVMENAKTRLEVADERLRAAVKTFEDSVEEAFGYEALLRQVGPLTRSLGADVPTLPGDEIPPHERKRALDALAESVNAAYYRLAEKVGDATHAGCLPSEDPLENFDRLEAKLIEIESATDR